MADLLSIADGNFLDAATWALVDATSKLTSTNAAVTALTTGNLDSGAFTPGVITVDGLAIRLGSRAAGSPTNTMTITLRNSTAGADVISVTVNVSDLPVCTTGDDEGGWYFLKFSAPQLLLAATNYVVRATLSSTSTAVSLCTNGTPNNFQHLLVTTTTQAPAAGDDMYVTQVFDGASNPATVTTRAISMNENATTDYGSANANYRIAALSVSKGATVTWVTNSATQLRLSGHVSVFFGGTVTMGTSAAKVDRGTACILEFDCASDDQFGLVVRRGATFNAYGQSRTSGKDVYYCNLTVDKAVSATSIDVDTDTGWKSGDEVDISASDRTFTHRETKILDGDAGASSFSITVGLSFARAFTADADVKTEVVLLTRDVILRAVTSTATFYVQSLDGCQFHTEWAVFRSCCAQNNGLYIRNTTLTQFTMDYSVIRGSEGPGLRFDAASLFELRRSIFIGLAGTIGQQGPVLSTPTGSGWLVDGCFFSAIGNAGIAGFHLPAGSTFSNNRMIHCDGASTGIGMTITGPIFGTFENNVCHSNSTLGIRWDCDGNSVTGANMAALQVLKGLKIYLNNGTGILCNFTNNASYINVFFDGLKMFGNITTNLAIGGGQRFGRLRINDFVSAGLSGFTTTNGMTLGTILSVADGVLDNCTFGVAAGSRVAHTNDINVTAVSYTCMRLRNCVLASATEVATPSNLARGAFISSQRHDQTSGLHKTWTSLGTKTIETTTVDVSPSVKLEPLSATIKYESGDGQPGRGFLVKVVSGQQPTFSIKVRKNAAYNGNAPRFILKRNTAVHVEASDTVLGTLSVGVDTWEVLSAQVPTAAIDNGEFEVIVDCDGTAGAVFADTLTKTL